MTKSAQRDTRERRQKLWRITISPSIWALHFLVCYVTAAIWCEKIASRIGHLGGLRLVIAGLTAAALLGIAFNGWDGWRRHSLGGGGVPHDDDHPLDRHRFLGYTTFLLAALSAVATVFTALVALFFQDCR